MGAVDFLHKPIEPDILRSKAEVFFELYVQRQQVARQRDELKSNADALKEADRRKDEFLAVLAHELRNPLAPIRYGLEIMRMSPDKGASEEIRAMMERQVTHLVRLIDDLLDVSRVSRGKIELRRERVTIQTALQAAIESCKPLVESRHHTLSLEISDQPLWIDADLTRVAQVVSNLLNNAAKYTPEGGSIKLAAFEDAGDAVVAVSDNGVGISAEMLPRVFELFTQAESGVRRSQGGLGIGLALAHQLVDMHEGSIGAASEGEDKGSMFTVRLPLKEAIGVPAEVETLVTSGRFPLHVLGRRRQRALRGVDSPPSHSRSGTKSLWHLMATRRL